ncbi:MAG: hypothetical protein N2C14_23885, partial [Planctomycetales bacterium]
MPLGGGNTPRSRFRPRLPNSPRLGLSSALRKTDNKSPAKSWTRAIEHFLKTRLPTATAVHLRSISVQQNNVFA